MKIQRLWNESTIVITALIAGLATVALVATIILAPPKVQANPQHAAETKLPCTQCHTDPAGGKDKLTPFGKKFKEDGFKLPGK